MLHIRLVEHNYLDEEQIHFLFCFLILRKKKYHQLVLLSNPKAINAAKVCGLSSFIGEIDNYDKFILEKSVKDLSSGQKQRLSLARAVYQNRKILILDEPTSNLDKKTEDRFFENIFQVFEKKIIVVVSHNLDNFEQFDKVLIVKNGILNQVEKVSLRKLINLL